MTNTLQKKFVMTSMLVVTVLLVILLGFINVTNIIFVEKDIDNRLDMITTFEERQSQSEENPQDLTDESRQEQTDNNSQNQTDNNSQNQTDDNSPQANISEQVQPEDAPQKQESTPPPGNGFSQKPERDRFISSNFFMVEIDDEGDVRSVDVSRTSQVSEATAEEYATKAMTKDSLSGKSGKYRYQIIDSQEGSGKVAVFLDTSDEMRSCLRVLSLSASIGLVCWILMLILTYFLSKRAIRPIAENIENQKQFITNAGHEVKTPLAIIQANVDVLELHNGGSKWTSNIKEQVSRLNGLTKQMLSLAKADEGVISVTRTEFLLDEVVRATAQSFEERMTQKDIHFTASIAENIDITADKEQLTQLVSILMDNAVKYSNESGAINVTLEEVSDSATEKSAKKTEKAVEKSTKKTEKTAKKPAERVTLKIENTCDKLPDCKPTKLFERFYREDKARTQKTGGYGIGLSIARSIAEANGSKISCEYCEPNRIVFIVRL